MQLNYCSDNTFDVGVLKLECTFKTDLKQKNPKVEVCLSQCWTHCVTSYPFFDALTGVPTVCSVHGVSPLIGRQRRRVLAVLLVLALDQAQLAP